MKKITDRELRQTQLKVLATIHCFCVKNKIKYFLVGGTLIGAIRHNGFIPWDDDIDIAMLRRDYEKFISTFHANGYYIASPQTINNYYAPFAKVVDETTRLKEHISSEIEIGVNVDVFPYDNVPDDLQKAKKQYSKSRILYNLLLMKSLVYKKRPPLKNLTYLFGKIITKPLSYDYLTKQIEKNAKKYNNQTSGKVSQIVYPLYKEKTTWPKSLFDEIVLHKFENEEYFIPKGYDKMLRITYGDYMILPPKEQQVAHHDYDAWIK